MFARKRVDPVISESNFNLLLTLIDSKLKAVSKRLSQDLRKFKVVSDCEISDEVVSIGSMVVFVDVNSGVTKKVQLILPNNKNSSNAKISVLSPLGFALLGCYVGDPIQWTVSENSCRTLKILNVNQTHIACEGLNYE